MYILSVVVALQANGHCAGQKLPFAREKHSERNEIPSAKSSLLLFNVCVDCVTRRFSVLPQLYVVVCSAEVDCR